MWDYGSEKENMKHYNSTKPPIYDVSKLDIPTLFIAGGNDYLGKHSMVGGEDWWGGKQWGC